MKQSPHFYYSTGSAIEIALTEAKRAQGLKRHIASGEIHLQATQRWNGLHIRLHPSLAKRNDLQYGLYWAAKARRWRRSKTYRYGYSIFYVIPELRKVQKSTIFPVIARVGRAAKINK